MELGTTVELDTAAEPSMGAGLALILVLVQDSALHKVEALFK